MTSTQSSFVVHLGNHAKVPIISFTATNPYLSSLRSTYFVRATLNDSSQVQAITAFIQAFGWKNVVPIYADDDFGKGIIPSLTSALNKIGTQIPYQSAINPSVIDQEIVAELYKLMTMQTRVFVLHMTNYLGSQVLKKAQELGMMTEGYVWIVSDGITNPLSFTGTSLVGYLKGAIGVKPYVPRTRMLDNFTLRWEGKYLKDVNVSVNVYGLWAYDATTALAMAIEKVGYMNNNFKKMNSSRNSVNLGSYLCRVLSSFRFNGLSGDFHIVNGQLQSSAFEIVNGIGDGERVIGFWTMKHGITRELNSTEKLSVRDIIWPGESKSDPKGWVIPTNGKKLKIGIPVNEGFNHFVNVIKDPNSNSMRVTGFCIDVFEAVMEALPYVVPFEYIPYAKPDGSSAGSYDELVYQVFLGNFDAVVGDVTIRANRSLYVDFTMPFTESGINMIVPVKDKKAKNAWVFLKPLTWDLWVTSFCFFIFVGLVIWILEHGINKDFNGTLPQQLGTSFWFSFSTMIFAHKEKLVSNLSRLVVIIWCFVVLILIQSYTASLTSTLTIKQLEPTFTSVEELMEKGEIVGYAKGSFIQGLLRNSNMSKLKEYKSRDELHIKFSKGEIGAAFDEIPYMKPFLAKHCSKYTMVGPTLNTIGFGFVFSKGSPLVPDVSQAVLSVTEGEKMEKIEKAWFGKKTNCPDPSTSMSSNSLGINSFWGLFVIVGVAASFALIIFTSMLVYENKNILMQIHPKDIWKNFVTSSRESGGTNTNSVTETTVRPDLINNEEATICDQENQNACANIWFYCDPSMVKGLCINLCLPAQSNISPRLRDSCPYLLRVGSGSGICFSKRYPSRVMTISSPTTSWETHDWVSSGTRDLLRLPEKLIEPRTHSPVGRQNIKSGLSFVGNHNHRRSHRLYFSCARFRDFHPWATIGGPSSSHRELPDALSIICSPYV
ncbi:hypothetical protein LguiB_005599 [Lonicera macranthoides]